MATGPRFQSKRKRPIFHPWSGLAFSLCPHGSTWAFQVFVNTKDWTISRVSYSWRVHCLRTLYMTVPKFQGSLQLFTSSTLWMKSLDFDFKKSSMIYPKLQCLLSEEEGCLLLMIFGIVLVLESVLQIWLYLHYYFWFYKIKLLFHHEQIINPTMVTFYFSLFASTVCSTTQIMTLLLTLVISIITTYDIINRGLEHWVRVIVRQLRRTCGHADVSHMKTWRCREKKK